MSMVFLQVSTTMRHFLHFAEMLFEFGSRSAGLRAPSR